MLAVSLNWEVISYEKTCIGQTPEISVQTGERKTNAESKKIQMN